MGGTTGTQQQNTNQTQNQFQQGQNQGTSQVTPWANANPTLQSILGTLNRTPLDLTSQQSGAISQLGALGQAGNPFSGAISAGANNLLGGAGYTNLAPYFNNSYSNLANNLAPITDPNNLNPFNTPGFGTALSTVNSDITNQINQMFAGAGRDMSGLNQQALARGLAQGEGGLIASQYNQNVGNLLNANNSLFGAGQSTGTNLAGLTTDTINSYLSGLQGAQAGTAAQQYGPLTSLQAAGLQSSIPLQNLTQALGIANPLAAAYGTQATTGTQSGVGQGTQAGQTSTQLSPIQQLALLAGAYRSAPQQQPTGTTGGAPSGFSLPVPSWLPSFPGL